MVSGSSIQQEGVTELAVSGVVAVTDVLVVPDRSGEYISTGPCWLINH